MSFGLCIFPGIVTALSPIHHGGNEKTGSVSLLNRQRWIVNGEPMDIPFISGNSIRGQLRQIIMTDMLKRLDYNIDVESSAGRKVFHGLFSGGILESTTSQRERKVPLKKDSKPSDDGFANLKIKKQLYDLFPPVRLLGLAWGNQLIESVLKVGQMLPICTELKEYLPDKLELDKAYSVYNYLSQSYQTRKDLLGDRKDNEQARAMLVDREIFIPGTKFYHEFRLEDPTPLTVSTLAHAVQLWSNKGTLGANTARGFGIVKIGYKNCYPPSEHWHHEKYMEHINEHGNEMREALAGL